MTNLRHVVAGTDFTPTSAGALKEAYRIAKGDGADLTAFHAVEASIIEEFKRHADIVESEILSEVGGRLDRHIEEVLGEGSGVHSETVIGHQFEELIRAVSRKHADLLVLGSHGIEHDKAHIGTLASRCIRKAPVNVLLVRDRKDSPFKKIVACIDFSENAKKAARQAAHIAVKDGAKLEFLHISQIVVDAGSGDIFGEFVSPVSGPVSSIVTEQLEQELADFAREITGEVGIKDGFRSEVIMHTNVRKAIGAHVRELGADLVVLGTRGRTGLRSLLLGTTAEKIIEHSPCSVLTIKPDGFAYEVD